MIKKMKFLAVAASVALFSPAVFAQTSEEESMPGSMPESMVDREPAAEVPTEQPIPGKIEAETEAEVAEEKVEVKNFAIRPHAGAIFFDGNERFSGGLMLDYNFLTTPMAKVGPSIGALYSSLSGNDFFDGVGAGNDQYIFQVPLNVKGTIAPDAAGRLQLGAHAGVNVVYSTGGLATDFGSVPFVVNQIGSSVAESSWESHPNVGADVDYAVSDAVDLTLRPDVTFMDQFDVVTTTLGLGVKL